MKKSTHKLFVLAFFLAAFMFNSNSSKAIGYWANFDYKIAGLKVSFHDTTYTPFQFSKWSWDFGDGDTSNQRNPVHTYAKSGTYHVKMKIYDNVYNYWDTVSKNVTVSATCLAKYTYSGVNGKTSFINTSSTSSGKNKYVWDFGDGSGSSQKSPQHTYYANGTYYALLWVYDTVNSCSDSVGKYITVTNAGNCNAGFDYQVKGYLASFTDTSFNNSGYHSCYWTFGDGTSSTQANPSHQYSSWGNYTVCLVMSDSNCSDTACQNIYIDSCYAKYSNSISGRKVDFTNLSSSLKSATASYVWDFGDSTANDTNVNTSHTFSTNGSYQVCLYMKDNGCSNVFCDQVVINVFPACKADFGDSTVSGTYEVYFTDLSKTYGSQTQYSWDFGDGNSSSSVNPNHTYSTYGTYSVCLSISDSAANCSDKYCRNITLSNTQPQCHAQFSYKQSKKVVDFTDMCSGVKAITTYTWDFGDGNTSSNRNPSHTYSQYGLYQVILSINDSDCSDLDTMLVAVYNDFHISGTVYLGNTTNAADYGKVWAVHYDSASSSLAAFDSTNLDSAGNYDLKVPSGYYLVKAALESNSSQYSNYLPTYYNDKLHWDTANLITLNANTTGVDIHLIAGYNPGGPGFIEGYTSQGANKTGAFGDPVQGLEIVLYNNKNEAVAYSVSDVNGKFKFNNLAYGTYSVHPEYLGKLSTPMNVTLSSSYPSESKVKVEVNRYYVSVSLNTSIASFASPSHFVIYPNPASQQLNMTLSESVQNTYSLSVYDMQGKAVSVPLHKMGATAQMNVTGLPVGIYMIMLQTQDGNIYKQYFTKE